MLVSAKRAVTMANDAQISEEGDVESALQEKNDKNDIEQEMELLFGV